ncbi:1-deoxy-D-xylulose-5-phosphate synthase [Mycoplasmatota bacterium]|nr:1-deoxy-D-xylulose-5-phosphate synthase [Mycoplasmatota bacterium]
MQKLYDIKDPKFLSTMSIEQLEQLCAEIRTFLIESVSKTGGHLGPNLGVVELSVALHKVFNSPYDKFIFDVGHQAYTHKILTGRAKYFDTLRKYNGLSGFPKMSESEHDVWETGHSSTSISAAAGFVYARDYLKEKYHVLAVIGDGSLTGGMAFEALNHLGQANKKIIVILNDNKMSISQNVGAMTNMLNRMRLSRKYNKAKKIYLNVINKEKHMFSLAKRIRDGIKSFFLQTNIFEEMGFEYYGPIDGHDLPTLVHTFNNVKAIDKPVLIHAITKKGKGYSYAEEDIEGLWHGVSPFDIITGKSIASKKENLKSWSNIISEGVTRLAEEDSRIVVITPAMKNGSGLKVFEDAFPDRLIDVGIAEEHAITFAGGLASNHMKPYVAIYSTFLQRAYDQVNHDLARQNLPVVIGIDRAGLVDGDGSTHQGIFDISFLRHIPNTIIMMPKDPKEAYDLLYTAFESKKLTFLRYPRGNASVEELTDHIFQPIKIGTWTKEREGNDLIFISYGPSVSYIKEICDKNELNAKIINARFIKPIDEDMLSALLKENKPIIIFEESIKVGGLNSAILEFAQKHQFNTTQIYSLAIDDQFVEQGDKALIFKDLHLDEASILKFIEQIQGEMYDE